MATQQNRLIMISGVEFSITKMYLVWAKDVGVVVKVTKCAESMFMGLELDKAIT